jgi:hypothetical protein
MKQAQARGPTERELLTLIYELLDAHADTIGVDSADELRWAAHIDYLRALQRKAKEMLARWPPALESMASR